MTVYFDSRWIGEHGIGRFAREVRAALPDAVDIESARKPSSPLDPFALAWRLARLRKGDVFYSPGYNAPAAGTTPFVFTIHDLNHIEFPGARSAAKSAYYRYVMRPACRRARAVLTVSEYSRRRIAEWSGVDIRRIHNVGNGVDRRLNPQGERFAHPRPYLLCVSNRRPHKNERRTLEAFAAIAARVPHDLLFIGAGTPELEAWIASLGVADRVHFVGRVGDEGLASLYRTADAVVFVSLYEGFGLPVIEAQASGSPVVTSNVTSLPEIAGDGAVLVDPTDTAAIALALAAVLGDPALRSTLIERGHANAQRYSWDRTAARVRSVIEACRDDA